MRGARTKGSQAARKAGQPVARRQIDYLVMTAAAIFVVTLGLIAVVITSGRTRRGSERHDRSSNTHVVSMGESVFVSSPGTILDENGSLVLLFSFESTTHLVRLGFGDRKAPDCLEGMNISALSRFWIAAAGSTDVLVYSSDRGVFFLTLVSNEWICKGPPKMSDLEKFKAVPSEEMQRLRKYIRL